MSSRRLSARGHEPLAAIIPSTHVAHHRAPKSAWRTPSAFETHFTILGRGRVLTAVLEKREI
jgi:hypothetical protein